MIQHSGRLRARTGIHADKCDVHGQLRSSAGTATILDYALRPAQDGGERLWEASWPSSRTFWRPSATRRSCKITKLAPPGINLYVKIEAFNPLGSVKDRLALGVIEAAEKSGALKPGQTVIEATSGNTGIGLAMVCAAKGYPLVVTMAETFSVERRKLMRFLGAKVVLTPAAERGMGMVHKAQELAKSHGWFLTRQFENEANPDMHERTTGARSSTTSKARSSTTGSPASAPAARSPASRVCCARNGPKPRSWSASRPMRPCSRPRRRRSATPTARRPKPTRRSSRIRCRAGARTSFRRSPPRRSMPASSAASSPLRGPTP